ncbi:MAG TPA: 3'(2'),5'-bisphosphate nucleotidase CysQ [Kofleriaceae bacterium]
MASELETALALAREAGEEAHAMQRGDLHVQMKPGEEPVTIADQRASEFIVAALRKSFPDDTIVSEELAPTPGWEQGKRIWFVDPIDGTKDFIRREDGWAVMIGLVVGGRPTMGVVHQAAADRTFWATPAGAFWRHGTDEGPLHVSDIALAADARLVASKSHRQPIMDDIKERLGIGNELNVGSVGVKLCLIASGLRDLYVNPAAKTKAWDTCAPEAILVRAGGRLSDLAGEPVSYAELPQRNGLVASNGHVHDEVIAKLGTLFPRGNLSG